MQHEGLNEKSAELCDGLLAATQAAVPGVPVKAEMTQFGQVIDIALTVLGPGLLALVVLALRNRVRR